MSENPFTVKSGLKFGLGFYIGRSIFIGVDRALGKVLAAKIAKLRVEYPGIFVKE